MNAFWQRILKAIVLAVLSTLAEHRDENNSTHFGS